VYDTEEQFRECWKKYESKITKMIYIKYARSLEYRANYFEDLLQAARVGLYRALLSYDSNKSKEANNAFWAYAIQGIEGCIKDELSRLTATVYAPRRIRQLANKIEKQHFKNHDTKLLERVNHPETDTGHAIEFLKAKNTISIDRPRYMHQEGAILVDTLHAPTNLGREMLDGRFLAMLNEKECKVATLINQGYTVKEVTRRFKNGYQIVGSLGVKLRDFLNIKSTEEKSMIKQSKGVLTKEKYLELKSQNISNKQIAVTHKMSPTTLAKMRQQWGINSEDNRSNALEAKYIVEEKIITETEYKRILDAYERLKCEYELLWKYHKQVLQQMDSPYSRAE